MLKKMDEGANHAFFHLFYICQDDQGSPLQYLALRADH